MSGVSFWKVYYQDIEKLDDVHLTELLKRLLSQEASKHLISPAAVSVSLKICVSDGGQDGRIEWEGGPEKTDYVPSRLTVFQAKATKMDPNDCRKELLVGKTKRANKGKAAHRLKLKPMVEEVLDRGGCYIVFCGREYVEENIKHKILEMRKGLKDAGKAYWSTANIKFYGAQKIADWTNQYLPAIIYVLKQANRPTDNLLNWKMWSEYSDNTEYEYVEDAELTGHLTQLRSFFTDHFYGKIKCARIIGLSGLGKTRLALEAFRPPSDPNNNHIQQFLSDSIIYVDGSTVDDGRLIDAIHNWRIERLSGILVVDDCDLDFHNKLSDEVHHKESGISLLTLDFNPEEIREHHDPDRPCILLKPLPDETIKTMLRQKYGSLPEQDIDAIVKFTQGFPQMAALLAKNRINGKAEIHNLAGQPVINKMLWGHDAYDKEAYSIISACSIFKLFGFDGRLIEQRKFIASNICQVKDTELYSTLVKFKDRELMVQRGDLAAIVPSPLAIRLGADWWIKCPPEEIERIINEMPQPLIDQLCAQMPAMRDHPKIIEIARRLCGEQGPFGRAEVLMSERGSRIFRDLAEVDPEITVDVLERIIGNKSRNDLIRFVDGRRNTIWTLEKLCFKKETFVRGARLLADLAEAENESWGNNATGQFLQLFHIRLSGTEAHPNMRISLIDELLGSNSNEKKKLAVRALGSALESKGFSRAGGSEQQGYGPPLKDWEPKKWDEIFDYSRQAIMRLRSISGDNDDIELANIACHEVVNSIRTLVRYGLMNELEDCLSAIQESKGTFWPEALIGIQHAIKFDGKRIPPEGLERLIRIKGLLEPVTLPDILFSVVSQPDYQFEIDDQGSHKDLTLQGAEQLGLKLAQDDSWFFLLPQVFKGEQRQGLGFGRILGRNIEQPDNFIRLARQALCEADILVANPVVLGGFLKGLKERDSALTEKYLEEIYLDDRMLPFFTSLLACSGASKRNLEQILDLIEGKKLPVESLRRLEHGWGLHDVNCRDVSKFCISLQRYGKAHSWVGMAIFYTYSPSDKEWTENRKSIMKRLLRKCYASGLSSEHHEWDTYYFCEAIKRSDPAARDELLLRHAINFFLDLIEGDRIGYNDQLEIASGLSLYLKGNPKSSWDILGKKLLEDHPGRWLLEHIIWDRITDKNSQVIVNLPNEILLNWCIENPEKAPLILSRNHPPIEERDGRVIFSSIFQQIFNRMGYDERIVDNIICNIETGAWTGPFSGYYARELSIINGLKMSYERISPALIRILNDRGKYWSEQLQKSLKMEEEESFREE